MLIGNARKGKATLGLLLESHGPWLASLAILGALVFYRHRVAIAVAAGDLSLSSLYSAVFNWSAIQVGFSFAVYGFVIGKTSGFVEEVRTTVAMSRFMGYTKRANIGGFILTICSLPLTVLSPNTIGPNSLTYFLVSLWFGLFVWTFLAFLRLAINFGHLSAVRDKPPFYGA